jgi:hypothetical protein
MGLRWSSVSGNRHQSLSTVIVAHGNISWLASPTAKIPLGTLTSSGVECYPLGELERI